MPPWKPKRDIVSSRKTTRGDAITVERTPRWPVWITAFDGEDEVGLPLSVKDAMWLMAALQVAIDGPLADQPRPTGPPTLAVVPPGSAGPRARHGPLGTYGRPRAVPGRQDDEAN